MLTLSEIKPYLPMKLAYILIHFAFLSVFACNDKTSNTPIETHIAAVESPRSDGYKNAYFASGCFWCVEAIYEHVKGVKEVYSGYAGGSKTTPSYRQVASGGTGHAETVQVIYDPKIVDFKTLLKVFYGSQDPTTVGQAPDFGQAYRSIIFYQNTAEKELAQAAKTNVQASYKKTVRTEILPFQKFWKAEDYHQDFETRNPTQSYIMSVSKPRLARFKAQFPELIKND